MELQLELKILKQKQKYFVICNYIALEHFSKLVVEGQANKYIELLMQLKS